MSGFKPKNEQLFELLVRLNKIKAQRLLHIREIFQNDDTDGLD
jgi:hypothetical protein